MKKHPKIGVTCIKNLQVVGPCIPGENLKIENPVEHKKFVKSLMKMKKELGQT